MYKSFCKKVKCGCEFGVEKYNNQYTTYFLQYCDLGFFGNESTNHINEIENKLLKEFLLNNKKYNIKPKFGFKDSDLFTIYGWKRIKI